MTVDLGFGYYVLAFLLMIGLSNATNLTDGLDGLAGGLAILTALGLAWTVYTSRPGFEQLPLFGYAVAGACLGFLWYNAHPAKVFMGDTGSLALGSSFAAMALIGKQEFLLLVFTPCFCWRCSASSCKSRTSRRPTGKRIFKMTPLHHHFELSGWAETQVVARFWIGGVLALALGLLCAASSGSCRRGCGTYPLLAGDTSRQGEDQVKRCEAILTSPFRPARRKRQR